MTTDYVEGDQQNAEAECIMVIAEELEMANATELTRIVDRLEERVTNHIRFFWAAVALGFVWMGAITGYIANTNSKVNGLARAQADAPANIVASLLRRSGTKEDEVAGLVAATTVLRTTKKTEVKPDSGALNPVSVELSKAQNKYPEQPEVWQATSAFINYKSYASPYNEDAYRSAGHPCHFDVNQLPSGFIWRNCEVNLEEIEARVHDNFHDGRPIPLIFIECIVHYDGGVLWTQPLIFKNSSLRFDVSKKPSPIGEVAMRKLTVADPKTETIRIDL